MISNKLFLPFLKIKGPKICKAFPKDLVSLLGVALTCSLFCTPPLPAIAQEDPFDPFSRMSIEESLSQDDANKSAEQLLIEGTSLLQDERPLDARTKLLLALKKDPSLYQVHLTLAGYYMVDVGHFRLALKYIKQGEKLFYQKHGNPPYSERGEQAEHARILYLLSQARLSLDNYQGALDALDEYASQGYMSDWYPGSRAWILMKLGRIPEAIQVARVGILAGAEPGRTLNMLGILLSMNDQPQAALQVLKDALTYELSMGTAGQPATPLNNSGEVYKEIFDEDKAENSWLRAKSMPDGCEHVLPSLNLSILYIEEMNYRGAKNSLDTFESCVKQYVLRNGEEHVALVHLMRGRLELLTGNPEKALPHLESALENIQWFGKIGTSKDDLQAAALTTLSQALAAQANRLKYFPQKSLFARLSTYQQRSLAQIRSWWAMRKARQLLSEDLNNLEDLHIRNTDSLLEYPTLGDLLEGIPSSLLQRRIEDEKKIDGRAQARLYYEAYEAQELLVHGREKEGLSRIANILPQLRKRYDDLLKLHLTLLSLRTLSEDSIQYRTQAIESYRASHAALRNYGLKLPIVVGNISSELLSLLRQGPFIEVPVEGSPFTLEGGRLSGGEFFCALRTDRGELVNQKGKTAEEAAQKCVDGIFSEPLEK